MDEIPWDVITGAGINGFLAMVLLKLWADLKEAGKTHKDHLKADIERLNRKLEQYEQLLIANYLTTSKTDDNP